VSPLPRDTATDTLAAALRACTTDPLPFTFRQLRRLVEGLVDIAGTVEEFQQLTLRDLEELLEPEVLDYLPLRTVAAIVDAVVEASEPSRTPEDVFDNFPLQRLAGVVDRGMARLSIDDVVMLASFARDAGDADDVLAALRLTTVRRGLSDGALGALQIKHVREVIERIAAA
jgi:hypothetical protein